MTRTGTSTSSTLARIPARREVCGTMVTDFGTRSWSRSSVAWKWGSDSKRFCIGRSSRRCASASTLIPWWCAMNERITALVCPRGSRAGV